MRALLIIALFGFALAGSAQTKVAFLPCEDVLFLSDVTDEFSRESGLSPVEVRETVRHGVCEAARDVAPMGFKGYSLSVLPDSVAQKVERRLYQSLVRTYKQADKHDKLAEEHNADVDSTHADTSGTRYLDLAPKYLSAEIIDPGFIYVLDAALGCDRYVTINQLDIVTFKAMFPGQPAERWVRAHFTVFDKSGKVLEGGLARASIHPDVHTPAELLSETAPELMAFIWRNIH
ncbi:MAG: hypothetical protein RL220_399 [Bacteroidota bacterium]|jgi:hypothetical protein